MKRLLFLLLLLSFSILTSPVVVLSKQVIDGKVIYRVVSEQFMKDSRYPLARQLLELAFQKSEHRYGTRYELRDSVARHYPEQNFRQLEARRLPDIMWATTSLEREERARAVYFPIFKGLMGKRVHLVAQSNQALFVNLSKTEAQQLTYCIGTHWPDRDIYYKNGFVNLVEAPTYLTLQRKIRSQSHFCHAFSRGAHEAIIESLRMIPHRFESQVGPEQYVMFEYDAPVFFFVRNRERELAERIRFGLEHALADGSLNRLFYNDRSIAAMMAYGNLENRQVIHLENELSLRAKALYRRQELWFSPKDADRYRNDEHPLPVPPHLKENFQISIAKVHYRDVE